MRKVIVPDPKSPRAGRAEGVSVKMLIDRTREAASKGPGPSKIAFRLSRIWKKLWVRRTVLIGLPLIMVALIGWSLAQNPVVHRFVSERKDAVMSSLSERPEFAVIGMRIAGASAGLRDQIEATVALPDGASSLNLDVAGLQARVSALPPVRTAKVNLRADGVLDIRVDERIAETLWRDDEGALHLADRDGVAIADVAERAAHPHLPVVIGNDAPVAMAEALAVFRAAPDLQPRIRALIRVGARRWDVVLDRGLTIMLPADKPDAALARVMAWHFGEELLDRGVGVIDMRLSDRPTIRMNEEAAGLFKLQEAARTEAGEDT